MVVLNFDRSLSLSVCGLEGSESDGESGGAGGIYRGGGFMHLMCLKFWWWVILLVIWGDDVFFIFCILVYGFWLTEYFIDEGVLKG